MIMETRVCTHWQHHQMNMLLNGPDNHNQLTFVALKPTQVAAISIAYTYMCLCGVSDSRVCPSFSLFTYVLAGLNMLESRCNISASDFFSSLFILYRLLLPFQLLLDDLHTIPYHTIQYIHRSLEWGNVYE